jgi:putative aldouronate transport system permease protein
LVAPLGFSLKGYELVFKNKDVINGFLNTIFYVVVGTSINLLLTSMSAYVLSRKDLLWGKFIMFMVTFTMFFSGGLIPLFLQVDRLGLYNTRWAIILPGAISVWNLILMRTSFLGIPDSLEESARMDGANDFTVLFRIILPVSKATLAVIALFYAVGQWNSWFNAMIFLRDRSKYPLQLILREILINNDTREMMSGAKGNAQFVRDDAYKSLIQYCTIVVATIPILFVYPFLQKYFVKGVMIGSIKG